MLVLFRVVFVSCNCISSGLCSFFLGGCYYACLATTMGEHCCVGCSGHGAGVVPGGHVAMRAAFRNKHGIPVSRPRLYYVACLDTDRGFTIATDT